MGRRNSPTVFDLYKKDIDALSDFMGEKKYFFDDKVRNIDATVYAILRHLHDQPMKWEGDGYVGTKKNLVGYLERMREEFKI
jgi:isoprene-epoxide---glutathione S-transferase